MLTQKEQIVLFIAIIIVLLILYYNMCDKKEHAGFQNLGNITEVAGGIVKQVNKTSIMTIEQSQAIQTIRDAITDISLLKTRFIAHNLLSLRVY